MTQDFAQRVEDIYHKTRVWRGERIILPLDEYMTLLQAAERWLHTVRGVDEVQKKVIRMDDGERSVDFKNDYNALLSKVRGPLEGKDG